LAPADAGEKQEATEDNIPADAEEKQADLDLLGSRQVGEAAVEVEHTEVALDALGNPGLRGIEVASSSHPGPGLRGIEVASSPHPGPGLRGIEVASASHPGASICTRRRVDTSRGSRALGPYVVGL
jgi:hypothetical protein